MKLDQLDAIEHDKKIISGRPTLFKKAYDEDWIPMDRVLWFFSGPYVYSSHEIDGYNCTGTGWEAVDTYWSDIIYRISDSYEEAFNKNRMFKLPEQEWKGFLSCEKLDIAKPEHFKLFCNKIADDRYVIEMKGTFIYDIIKKSTLDGSPFQGLSIPDVFMAYFDAFKTLKGVSDAAIRRNKEARDKPDEFKGVGAKNIPKIMKKKQEIRNFSCAIDNTKTKIRETESTIQAYHRKIQEIHKNIENTEKEINELKKQ